MNYSILTALPADPAARADLGEGGLRVVVRGIDPPATGSDIERLANADELMALELSRRIDVIWTSGVRPLTAAMVEVFASCANEPGRGFFIGMSIQTLAPPSRRFHVGEGRLDPLVWGDEMPSPRRKAKTPERLHRRTRRQQEQAQRNFERQHSLWLELPCGCYEARCGADTHEAEAQKQRRREADLLDEQIKLAEALSRSTMR